MANMTDKATFTGKNCTIVTRYTRWWDVTVIFMNERGILFEDVVTATHWFKKTTYKRTMYVPMSKVEYIKTVEEVEKE